MGFALCDLFEQCSGDAAVCHRSHGCLHLIRLQPEDILGFGNGARLHTASPQLAQQPAQRRIAQTDIGKGILTYLCHGLPRLESLFESPAA
ncbi:MAG: hypothetical protein BWY63_00650 [Chloroflexi bacterium ADurb.Bin360]|nr:MAG: hypothetical protein BWY63_00650 [Chloroflexi bacterium ADurb.Bin360]